MLGSITPEVFLRDYWQKKPLLVRGAWPGFEDPLSPDELAGLALEEGVESRLVMERGGEKPWQVEHGPFAEERLQALPKTHWSLLVQGVERLLPDVSRMLERFRFIPNWRLDDIMISYAPDHGSVGPHVDQYDVFLLQGRGRREWRIGYERRGSEDFIAGLDLKILSAFTPDETWLLEPGDLLYLPPGIPHYGIARGEAMTYSIGFRAPSRRDMLVSLASYCLDHELGEQLYADPGLALQQEPGEINPAALAGLSASLMALLEEPGVFAKWFGEFITEPKLGRDDPGAVVPSRAVKEALDRGQTLCRREGARLAFVRAEGGGLTLFAEGRSYAVGRAGAAFAMLLCREQLIAAGELAAWRETREVHELIAELIRDGAVSF